VSLVLGGLSLRNRLLLAPLAGLSTLPFRILMREYGAGLAFTEMISAVGITRQNRSSLAYLASGDGDHPLGVQLFGSDPALLAEAAGRVADEGITLVDINMGCPVPKVTKTGAGAALMKNPPLVGRIVRAVRARFSGSLTVKIRSGWDEKSLNAVEIARIAAAEGADAVTCHARTARQGFAGRADWRVIAQVKSALSLPVIGNGDVRCGLDAAAMIGQTNCDGVMIGRGALGNPWIFREALTVLAGAPPPPAPTGEEKLAVCRRHWELEKKHFGADRAARTIRPHLLWYTRGLPGGAEIRSRLSQGMKEEEFFALLARAWGGGETSAGGAVV
jgi:nifR3 family TIM-barrel protein